MFYNYIPYGISSRVGFILNFIHKWNLSVVLKFVSRRVTVCSLNLLKKHKCMKNKDEKHGYKLYARLWMCKWTSDLKKKQAGINTN